MSRQIFEYEPTLGYRFIPGIKARIPHRNGGYVVQANQAGFRSNHEFEAVPTAGKRLLLFGDSFTAGDGVCNHERYGDRLEQRIPGLTVYNFGLPGTGTDQQYLAYREYGSKIENDLLVIAVLVENIRRNVSRYRVYFDESGREVAYAKPYFELSKGSLHLHGTPVPKLPISLSELGSHEEAFLDRGGRFPTLRRMATQLGLKEHIQRLTKYQPLPGFQDPHHADWKLMEAILKNWITESPQKALVVPLPLYYHIEEVTDPGPYQARFKELADLMGCYYHDPLADFQRAPLEERRRFRFGDDPHYTAEAHELLAQSLAPVVRRILDL